MFTINIDKLFSEYSRILDNEEDISSSPYFAPSCSAEEIMGIVQQLECVIRSSFVPRCCNTRYGTFRPGQLAPESVSAHTNLLQIIVDRVLSHRYGPNFEVTEDGFTYREVMEAARRHDLPENVIGDVSDNGARDNEELAHIEHSYLRIFAQSSPAREANFEIKVRQLLCNMEIKQGFSGRLLYAADKCSAILTTLRYDAEGASPTMATNFKGASAKDTNQMMLCEFRTKKSDETGTYEVCRASEMWTIDYFKSREIYRYDDTGLITAIIVMYSLINNGKWYAWREKDYEST